MIDADGQTPEQHSVSVDIGGENLGVRQVTAPMLESWVRALDGPNPFLIVHRPDDSARFIQIYRDDSSQILVEVWDDGDQEAVNVDGGDVDTRVAGLTWDWIRGDRTGWDALR